MTVSPDGRYAYMANYGTDAAAYGHRAGLVMVIDVSAGQVTQREPLGCRPESLAVTPDGRRVYVTCPGPAGMVTVLHPADAGLIAQIPASNPRAVAIAPDGRHAYVLTGGVVDHPEEALTVIDTNTSRVTASIPIPDVPSGIAVSSDGRRVYVASENPVGQTTGSVSVIDTADARIEATVAVGRSAQQLAAAPDGRHVYVIDRDSSTIAVLATG